MPESISFFTNKSKKLYFNTPLKSMGFAQPARLWNDPPLSMYLHDWRAINMRNLLSFLPGIPIRNAIHKITVCFLSNF